MCYKYKFKKKAHYLYFLTYNDNLKMEHNIVMSYNLYIIIRNINFMINDNINKQYIINMIF